MLNSVPAYAQSPDVLSSQNLGGFELHHAVFLTSCRLNEIGFVIWQHLKETQTLDALCQRVVAEYEVTPSLASSTIQDVLEELHGLGFLEVVHPQLRQDPVRLRYLDLLKKALMNLLYPEHELRIRHLLGSESSPHTLETNRLLRDIRVLQPEQYAQVMAAKQTGGVLYGEVTRYSHTAIGIRRLENLQACAETVFAEAVDGDFLEAGVCQGGASIFMRALQVVYGQSHRQMWVADSFEGLPVPSAALDVAHRLDWSEPRQPWLAIDLETVREHFQRYDLLSESVHFLQGWFSDTLAKAPVRQLAILRLDADLYSSTLDILESLYDRVSPGGFVVVDDYAALKPCQEAVDLFRAQKNIIEPLRRVDWSCVFWRKAW